MVRSAEVGLDQPLGQASVEFHGVCRHVAEADEFVLEGPVESLVDRF